ncbi:MAG: RHS repeat-associated core domain-containing protein [Rhodospirillaceae bacterium]|nr:RHS repeat-associated core domain-containing protein [Rhodospirillaceae bacterium]
MNSVQTKYIWADTNIYQEFVSGTLVRRYVPGTDVDEPIAMESYNPSAPTQYYHTDLLGSVVATTNAAGNPVSKYTYSSYGEPGSEGASGDIFRFSGRQIDAETGLYYYRARMYSSLHGRFMQLDPVGGLDSLNLYQYALWNPISNIDPFGLQSDDGRYNHTPLDQGAADLVVTASRLFGPSPDAVLADLQRQVQERKIIDLPLGDGGIIGDMVAGFGVAGIVKSGIKSVAKSAIKRSIDDLSRAAARADRNGLTKAGRGLQKHGDRPGSAFPQTKGGPNALNPTGQNVVDDILTTPGSQSTPNRLGGIDVIAPDGRGLRFDADGSFRGFLEP